MADVAPHENHPDPETVAEGQWLQRKTFRTELQQLINRHSLEQLSGTPDFLLAQFLHQQLDLFNQTIAARAEWRGESTQLPALSSLPTPEQ